MGKLYLTFFFSLLFFKGISQQLSMDELLNLSVQPVQKSDQYLSKKGFVKQLSDSGTAPVYFYRSTKNSKNKKEKNILNQVEKYQDEKMHTLVFRTSSVKECILLKEKLQKIGFTSKNAANSNEIQFQKKSISVFISQVPAEADTLYCFRFNKKILPSPLQINYANDLLLFNSHSDLAEVFGEHNIKKDLYYFTEKEIRSCSVLFPRTDRQAVFIWQEDSSLTGLASVVIGGSLKIESDINYTAAVAENSWILRNGLRSNMGLKELLYMNGADLRFYGKQSGYYMALTPQNKGKMNLKDLNVILGCLNCRESPLLEAETVSAEQALAHELGMFVMMIMIIPEKKEDLSKRQ